MKAEEKRRLYTLFSIASDYLAGYRRGGTLPFFADDEEALNEGAISEGMQTAAGLAVSDVSASLGQPSFLTLEDVERQISVCTGCALCKMRKNTVPGEGPRQFAKPDCTIEVMVIGEGPGADEDVQGRPFVGKAGQLLDKMLAAIELSRTENCYITNIVKCRPPQNRDPEPSESSACRRFLEAQISLIQPKAILAVGRIAMQNLLGTAEGITKLHGRFFKYAGFPLMAIYHPSALLRNIELKRPAWEDLKRFKAELTALKAAIKR